MSKPLAIAIKGFKEMFRNIKSTAIIFILPIVFMGVFATLFGQVSNELTFQVTSVQNDNYSYQTILDKLQSRETPTSKKLFEFQNISDRTEATTELEKGNLKAIFSWDNGVFVVQGDTQNPYFNLIMSEVSQAVGQYYSSKETNEIPIPPAPELVRIESVLPQATGDISGFQYLAPGLIIYGILMLVPYVTELLAGLVRKGELFRYFTSKTSVLDIFLGNLILLMVLALVQTILLYGVASFMGANFKGDILIALFVAIPTCLFTIGLGMLIGTFATKPDEASGMATIATVILGFLSGSFVQFPQISLGEFLGRTWQVTDLIPTAQASAALRGVLLFDQSLSDVTFEIVFLTVSSLIIFVIGLVAYKVVRFNKLEG